MLYSFKDLQDFRNREIKEPGLVYQVLTENRKRVTDRIEVLVNYDNESYVYVPFVFEEDTLSYCGEKSWNVYKNDQIIIHDDNEFILFDYEICQYVNDLENKYVINSEDIAGLINKEHDSFIEHVERIKKTCNEDFFNDNFILHLKENEEETDDYITYSLTYEAMFHALSFFNNKEVREFIYKLAESQYEENKYEEK